MKIPIGCRGSCRRQGLWQFGRWRSCVGGRAARGGDTHLPPRPSPSGRGSLREALAPADRNAEPLSPAAGVGARAKRAGRRPTPRGTRKWCLRIMRITAICGFVTQVIVGQSVANKIVVGEKFALCAHGRRGWSLGGVGRRGNQGFRWLLEVDVAGGKANSLCLHCDARFMHNVHKMHNDVLA